MINKETYDTIASHWKGKIYQKWPKLIKRLPMINNNLDFFKNTKVLELGSNAGIYGFILYGIIKSYAGIEVNKKYYKQSLETFKGKKVVLINKKFKDINLNEIDFDLFIASYVLHHLDEDEVDKLDKVFKKCKKIAIHTRSGDPLKYGHDEIGFDPIPKWSNSRIKKMLDENGFKSELHLCKTHDYNGIYLILAEKRDNN